MKTTIQQRVANHPLIQWLGRVAAYAAIGLAGIFAAPTYGQTNTNGCFATPAGLVSWWRGEGDATDHTLANNGNLLSTGPFVNGAVGQAFVFTNGGHVQISSSPSLNVGLGAGLTIEGWIYPFTITIGRPIAEWPVPSGYGVHFFTWNNGALYAAVVDTDGNYNILESSPGVLTVNQWQHVALSYDKASGLGRMLVNGVTVAAAQLGSFTPKTDTELLIGYRPITSPFGPVSFEGLMDELSLYNRALTTNEIAAIVAAGSAGKCTSSNPAPSPWLVNVDFGAGLNDSDKTGFATLGQTTNDFWNYYTRDDGAGGWRTFGVLSDLKTVSGTVTPAGLTVANAPGAWGNGSPDPMYDGYIYPFNGGNVTVTITNLPTGQYDLLAYAYDGNFELAVGGVSQGVRTSRDPTPTSPPVWMAGVQYASFTNITVPAGQPLVLTVRPGLDGYAVISGLQLAATLTTNTVPGTNPPSGGCVSLPSDAISWWRGEGDTLDAVGGNPGTATSAEILSPTGFAGTAFRFSGGAEKIELGDPASLRLTNAFTIETWILASNAPASGHAQIFFRGDMRGCLDPYYLSLQPNRAIRLHISAEDLANPCGVDLESPAIVLNQWTHVAGVFDGDAGSMKIYLNGALAVQTNTSVRPFGNLDPAYAPGVAIGNHSQGFSDQGFNGLIDELAVYSRALGSNEIVGICAAGSAGKCSENPPLACYSVSENFTTNSNPNGVWSYGYSPTLGGQMGLANEPGNWGGLDFWRTNLWLGVPGVYHNPSSQTLTNPTGTIVLAPGQLAFHPGPNGEYCVVRFTAPGNGYYQVISAFSGADVTGTTTDVHVLLNGSSLHDGLVNGYGPGSGPTFTGTNLLLQTGDRLDFAVGRGTNNEFSFDATGLDVRICTVFNPPLPEPPAITDHPTDKTINAGQSASFTVAASGTAPLSYQWFYNSNSIPNATVPTYFIANGQPAHAGSYFVVVSNPYGAVTSSVATLTVLTFPPFITRQPTNVTAIESTTASFSVQATGSMPLTYQWLLNGSPLAGKTATTLSFPSVQFSNAGNYSVIITNPYGTVTSSVAALTVNPLPPCAPVHDGLVSWWRGENNNLDGWGSNNGPSQTSAYRAGKVGQAFSSASIAVPDSASLAFTNELTIEAWINPATSSFNLIPILIRSPQFSQGASGFVSSYLLGLTNQNRLSFSVGVTSLTSTQSIPVNVWTHVAASYSATNGLRLFINGQLVSSRAYTNGIPMIPGTTYIGAGGISSGGISSGVFGTFPGLLDEVSLYQRALSAAEIQAIVSADLTGKCLAPPVITQQPQDQAVPLGEDVKLTTTITGSRPLTYQWYLNGPATQFTTQRITGATNAFLVIEKVKTNNIGTYTLRVTNSIGFDLSAPAQITLLPAPSCTEILPGLISWWPGDTNTLDTTGLNNIATYSPASYPTGKVASAFTFNGVNSRIQINNTASLNFGSNANFSIEMWIRATNSPPAPGGSSPFPNVPLFEKRTAETTGWVGYSLSLNQGRLAFAIGALGIAAPGTMSNYISSGPDLRDAMFHHVAVTVNRSATNGGVLYVDGVPVLTFNPKPLNVSLLNNSPLFIGAPATILANSYFAGLIDEPAIYNRALTAAEILSIRTAGAAGRCKAAPVIVTQPVGVFVTNGGSATLTVTATGTPLLRYQWRRNAIPVNGATNATLNLSNVTTAIAGTYSVIVSNAFGFVTSSNAVVVLNRLPIANADALNTPSNTPAVFPAAKLILNDTDADGDPLTVTAVSPNSSQDGTVSLVSGLVTYSPPSNFTGNDTFTYSVADGRGGTATGTVMVTVGSGGAAPMNIVFGPMIDNGQFVARFAGIPGLTYTIEAAPSLQGAWIKVANITAPMTDTGLGIGVFEFREPVGGAASRYYRTIYPSY